MKGKYLFTSFIMISLIMIVSASCGSSKTDKTSQETPVNYTGENINQLLTYTVPDGYHIDTENCTDKNEASYTINLSSDDLDEEVFTLEIISYKKQGVSITDDCDIDMDYLLNVSKDSVIKKITLNDTFTVDGHSVCIHPVLPVRLHSSDQLLLLPQVLMQALSFLRLVQKELPLLLLLF